MENRNDTLLCDFYELTMANGYFELGKADEIAYFDVFFRTIPDGGGFAIAAGLAQVVEYIQSLHFTAEDIAFFRTKGILLPSNLRAIFTPFPRERPSFPASPS